jgi:hypothetical protein
MALSTTQRADMQADLAIGSAEDVFTNTELDRLYERASNDYNLGVYLAWRQLMADAAKFHDYTIANASVKRSQLYDHIKKMVDFWQDEARGTANQVMIVGGLRIPPSRPDMPDDMRLDTRTDRYEPSANSRNRRSRYEVNRGL